MAVEYKGETIGLASRRKPGDRRVAMELLIFPTGFYQIREFDLEAYSQEVTDEDVDSSYYFIYAQSYDPKRILDSWKRLFPQDIHVQYILEQQIDPMEKETNR